MHVGTGAYSTHVGTGALTKPALSQSKGPAAQVYRAAVPFLLPTLFILSQLCHPERRGPIRLRIDPGVEGPTVCLRIHRQVEAFSPRISMCGFVSGYGFSRIEIVVIDGCWL